MKKEDLCDIIGNIDDNYIERATLTRKRIPNITKLAIAAVLAAITLSVGALLIPKEPPVDPYADLQPITLSEFIYANGMEALDAYGIDEIVSGNPWSEDAELTELPVFRNYLDYSEEMHKAIGADRDKMMAVLLDVAERLGISEEELTVTDDGVPEEEQAARIEKMGGYVPEGFFELNTLRGETDKVRITVRTDLEAEIAFKTPIALPEEYNFDHYASLEDMSAVAEYFKKEYANVIKIDSPSLDISGGDYNINLEQDYSIAFYDAGDGITESILNYNFKSVEFYGWDNELRGIRIQATDISGVEGVYPIITPEEAKELFAQGHYTTSVLEYEAKPENIRAIELVYRCADTDEYFIPYYRLLVEIETEKESGINTYGAYYVPAIKGEYISNMPTYDGSFN